jgi:CRISPR-associated endonuclease/helicase Cas3
LGNEQRIFYAHSVPDRDKRQWQPLAEHLRSVAEEAGARGAKFGARNAAAFAGLMHDLGKYSLAFQRRLEGAGEKVDHSTAGAQQVVLAAADRDSKIIAKAIAHAIAGHHAGLPDTIGDEASLNTRLKREVEALDPAWLREISPVVASLMPAINWGDGESLAYRLAFFGRMIFSCLVDADFRDTEAFYCAAEGPTVDRDWPRLPDVVDVLISRFGAFVTDKMAAAKATRVNALRAEILAHVRGRAEEGQGLLRTSLSAETQDYLSKLESWFDHIVDFRDALAHRIPLFIPPYCVPDANDDAYMALEARKLATRDADEYERVKAQQLKLTVFQPVMKHTLQDKKPPVVFHFQLLQDFGTVEEIGDKMLGELERTIGV